MDKYILRKEYFGGIIADVNNFCVNSVDKIQYEAIKELRKIKNDSHVNVYECETHDNVLSAPTSSTIYPSLKCNSDCEFCFVKSIEGKYRFDMTYKEFCECVDKLKLVGVIDIEIMGGEPLLIPWILDGILYIANNGMHVSINTNAILLDDMMLNRLGMIENLSLRISIQDGFDSLPSYILQMLEICKKQSIRIDILSVLQKKNCDKLIELLRCLPKEIVKNLIILYDNPPKGKLPKYSTAEFYAITSEISEYSKNNNFVNVVAKGPFGHCYKERKGGEMIKHFDGECLACTSRFEIMPNGDVFPCVKYYSQDEFCMGNLRMHSIKEIWYGEVATAFRKKIEQYNNHRCKACSWNNFCSGCVGFAEGLNLKMDDRCPRRK